MTTPGVSHPSPTTEEDVRRVLDARAVQPLFQPLIDPESRSTGPAGRPPSARRSAAGGWDLIVIGPRFAAALVANDLGDQGPDDQRRYDPVVTHDRELVIRAAEPCCAGWSPSTDRRVVAGLWVV
jgi:hypothetical protein